LSFVAGQETYRIGYDAGFEDGQKAGQKDRETRKAYDFANDLSYQNANNGFDEATHVRDVFVLAYRRGFEDGYEKGYGLGAEDRENTAQSPRVESPVLDRSCRLPEGTEIEIKLLNLLSTQRNERGDSFTAEVIQQVECDQEVAVPIGTKILGNITHLKRAGRIRGRSEMNLEFVEMELPNGVKVPITATVASIEEKADEDVRDSEGTISGKGTTSRDVKRIGGGTGLGALIGVLAGGGKGAKIGAAVGAVAGVAGTLATRGDDIVLYPETELVIKLNREVSVSPDILRRAR
jgi:type IV secretion system protein VirB10